MSVFKESASYRPFTYTWAADAAQRHEIDMYWSTHQINLQDDIQQYFSKEGMKTATVSHDQNKSILDKTLCLFTEMDRTVGAGYSDVMQYIKNNEIRNMMFRFASREVTHQTAYALAAETFGFSNSDWTAFAEYKEMVDKLDIMAEDVVPFGARDELRATIKLTQILLGEGIGLFGAFATLLNQKRHGLMNGFNDINEWSLKDEQEHVTNNISTVKEMRLDLTEVERMALEYVTRRFVDRFRAAEHKYLELVFELGGAEGLTLEEMKGYIDYLCQLRLFQLGYVQLSEVPVNPLPWMEWLLGANKHSNFFEKKVTDYVHKELPGEINYNRYRHMLPEAA
ncbi:ribonucleotide-diphosphate reductase subunit beta [Pseudomonas sp. P8_250]|uniref:ribonucleotide-diphosphate reductase subunit beta n=1 Tax=Pseudomonas sp. P8_250 TaxID=3043446 RepID=UPI002A358DB8|nr:ribonucleotide-diphosphate reductase subunit beta [Pseudomonas sp. P8_250]MDX9668700.1 ribonucleotide-diphosphate reductase subunit beta [Pseudomonas sp. P8_250]